tara:strand:- start:553 stop:1065 length:513 start_codon:yes stop_codon:yes gene_type:complete
MIKNLYLNLILSSLFIIFLSSCAGKKKNFDIDLSNFKVPNKSEVAASNLDISVTSKTTNKIIKNNLVNYQNKSEILRSIEFGKIDPFSEEGTIDKVNNLNTNFKLNGFLNTKDNKYVFVSYLGQTGTITEESIGGENTTLLPNGAKVLNIDPKKLKLIINFEDEDYILEL